MSGSVRLLTRIYGLVAVTLMVVAFAGLLSRKMGFRIPIVSTELIPALHRHAVWGETLRGRAILVGGEEWFFLIILGIVVLLGIVTALLNKLIRSAK